MSHKREVCGTWGLVPERKPILSFKHYLYVSYLKFLHHPYYQSIRQFVVVGPGEEDLEKLVHLDFFKDGLDILFLQCLCMFLCPEIKEDEVFG